MRSWDYFYTSLYKRDAPYFYSTGNGAMRCVGVSVDLVHEEFSSKPSVESFRIIPMGERKRLLSMWIDIPKEEAIELARRILGKYQEDFFQEGE